MCGDSHVALVVGIKYRIAAHDCCLEIDGLTGTFTGWRASSDGTVVHDVLTFAEGFVMGPSWSTSGWDFEPLVEEPTYA